jgi:hypothetical protein
MCLGVNKFLIRNKKKKKRKKNKRENNVGKVTSAVVVRGG